MPAMGICSVRAVTRKPCGARVTASPCDIHTVSLVGEVLQQHACPGRSIMQLRAAVLALPGGGDLAPERLRHQLVPVADAQHRHAEVEQRRVHPRAVGLVHGGGAAATG